MPAVSVDYAWEDFAKMILADEALQLSDVRFCYSNSSNETKSIETILSTVNGNGVSEELR